MKILVLQDHLRSGGTERQSVLLANGFSQAGHATTLLTFRPGGVLDPTAAAAVQRRSLQPFDLGLDWFAPGLRRAVERIAPDVVLCMGRMANCHGDRIRRHFAKKNTRSIVIGTLRTGKKLPALYLRTLRNCSHIVANSRDARTHLVTQHGLPADKISVIYNSLVFPSASSRVRNDTLRRQHYASPSTCVMVDVAMFRREKNQRALIEIAAGLPASFDWQLWLAGDGPARAACEQVALRLGVADRVKFPGLVRDPSPLYAAADLAVHASWSESLSNFLIEAQAHGLPAVAYQAQGIEECFLPGQTGVAIPFGEAAAFRAAITHWYRAGPSVRDRAVAFARETFEPTRQTEAYLDLFKRLLHLQS